MRKNLGLFLDLLSIESSRWYMSHRRGKIHANFLGHIFRWTPLQYRLLCSICIGAKIRAPMFPASMIMSNALYVYRRIDTIGIGSDMTEGYFPLEWHSYWQPKLSIIVEASTSTKNFLSVCFHRWCLVYCKRYLHYGILGCLWYSDLVSLNDRVHLLVTWRTITWNSWLLGSRDSSTFLYV